MDFQNLSFRTAELKDLAEIQQLFTDTISAVCAKDYTNEQIKAWTAGVKDTERWNEKLRCQYFLLAEFNQNLLAFASLQENKHLDMFYVHKDHQNQGIANQLLDLLEMEALKNGSTCISSNVSITAKGFFEKKGFSTIAQQINVIEGIELINYKMEKPLQIKHKV
jgi:putative acetyltransferase